MMYHNILVRSRVQRTRAGPFMVWCEKTKVKVVSLLWNFRKFSKSPWKVWFDKQTAIYKKIRFGKYFINAVSRNYLLEVAPVLRCIHFNIFWIFVFDPFRSKDTKTEFVFVSVRSPLSNRSPHARDKISPLSFIAERSVGIIMSKLSSIMRLKESAGWIFEARWEGFYDEIGSFSVTDPWQMTIHKPWKSTGTVNIQHFYGTIRYGEWSRVNRSIHSSVYHVNLM